MKSRNGNRLQGQKQKEKKNYKAQKVFLIDMKFNHEKDKQ